MTVFFLEGLVFVGVLMALYTENVPRKAEGKVYSFRYFGKMTT